MIVIVVGTGMIEVSVVNVSRIHPSGFLVTVIGTSLVRIEVSVVVTSVEIAVVTVFVEALEIVISLVVVGD